MTKYKFSVKVKRKSGEPEDAGAYETQAQAYGDDLVSEAVKAVSEELEFNEATQMYTFRAHLIPVSDFAGLVVELSSMSKG